MTPKEKHLFANDVGDFFAGSGQMLFGDGVGRRVDCLPALQADCDERD